MSSQNYPYNIALSFAGEDRQYAEELAEVLKTLNIKVFYDKYEEHTLWGKNLYTHLSEVYQNQARFCVIFLSQHYAQKLWTNHERQAAQARAFQENKEYILPIRLDNTEIPGILPTIGYLKWSNADSIANAISEKLEQETLSQCESGKVDETKSLKWFQKKYSKYDLDNIFNKNELDVVRIHPDNLEIAQKALDAYLFKSKMEKILEQEIYAFLSSKLEIDQKYVVKFFKGEKISYQNCCKLSSNIQLINWEEIIEEDRISDKLLVSNKFIEEVERLTILQEIEYRKDLEKFPILIKKWELENNSLVRFYKGEPLELRSLILICLNINSDWGDIIKINLIETEKKLPETPLKLRNIIKTRFKNISKSERNELAQKSGIKIDKINNFLDKEEDENSQKLNIIDFQLFLELKDEQYKDIIENILTSKFEILTSKIVVIRPNIASKELAEISTKERFINLATKLKITVSIINRFKSGLPVSRQDFNKICSALKIDIESISVTPLVKLSQSSKAQAEISQVINTIKKQITQEHINKISEEEKYSFLADEIKLDLQTVQSFFKSEVIEKNNFYKISSSIGLCWKNIVDIENLVLVTIIIPNITKECESKIKNIYSQVKSSLLGGENFELNDIYIEVEILKDNFRKNFLGIYDLKKNIKNENNRLGEMERNYERILGKEAVKKHPRLIVLGKPGSGKTTFLQKILLEYYYGKLLPKKIPIFISLKDLDKYLDIEQDKNESLLKKFIYKYWCCNLNEEELDIFLKNGSGLFLFDGLDEIKSDNIKYLKSEIRSFINLYSNNRFIISCRSNTQEQGFDGEKFVDVEIADFTKEQMESFAKRWFLAKNPDKQEGDKKAVQFICKIKLQENHAIRELAVTPILLNLTCTIFQYTNDFPNDRSSLYQQGIDILLEEWDSRKEIERNSEYYRDLPLKIKKELLSYLAIATFEKGQHLFEKEIIQELIIDCICTSSGTNEPIEIACRTDQGKEKLSESILEAIETQHGLLVNRAAKVYSFSHLTFQEYFVSLYITNNYLGTSKNIKLNGKWREILLLLSEIMQNPEELLELMKQKIDEYVNNHIDLKKIIAWAYNKAYNICSDKSIQRLASVQAFYTAIACIAYFSINDTFSIAYNLALLNEDENLIKEIKQYMSKNYSIEYVLAKCLMPEYRDILHLDLHLAAILKLAKIRQDTTTHLWETVNYYAKKCKNNQPTLDSLCKTLKRPKNDNDCLELIKEIQKYWDFPVDISNSNDWQDSNSKNRLNEYFIGYELLIQCWIKCREKLDIKCKDKTEKILFSQY